MHPAIQFCLPGRLIFLAALRSLEHYKPAEYWFGYEFFNVALGFSDVIIWSVAVLAVLFLSLQLLCTMTGEAQRDPHPWKMGAW
jgi:hypothetical protein